MTKNPTTASQTYISEGTRITGEVAVEFDLRIDGALKGSASVAGVFILGPTGVIEGDVVARSATLAGHLTGNIRVQEKLVLEAKSVLLGDLQTRELVIQEGAIFQGRSAMDANARASVQQ